MGTRNGYGKLSVIDRAIKEIDLTTNFTDYQQWPVSFNTPVTGDTSSTVDPVKDTTTAKATYRLDLTPDDFFHFGTGYGDHEVDLVPLEEEGVVYSDSGISTETYTVLPGSSIKGAIAHRTAYHSNRIRKQWADQISENDKVAELQKKLLIGVGNPAVYHLFGAAAGQEDYDVREDNSGKRSAKRGHVMIDDIYLKMDGEAVNDKVFNHVAIDRFTGGAIDGALFSEKVSRLSGNRQTVTIDISIDEHLTGTTADQHVHALEAALMDICKGLLPLGGLVTKGHGMFTGTLYKDGEKLYSYE